MIELLVVATIIGIVTSIAVPALDAMLQRGQLKTVVQFFQDDMQFARTQAIKLNQNVIVSRIAGDLGNWCYGFTKKSPDTKTSCNCLQADVTASDYCDMKQVSGAKFSTTNLAVAASNNNTIDFRRGTVKANGLTFSTANYAARVLFSDTGRVRTCIPATLPTGTVGLPGLANC